jgi:cell division protein FtsQ
MSAAEVEEPKPRKRPKKKAAGSARAKRSEKSERPIDDWEPPVEGPDWEPPPRSGWFVSATKFLIGLSLVLGVSGVLAWGIYQFALSTPRFALSNIEVEGNRRYSEASLARIAGLSRGQNLFRIDLAQAEQRLVEDPWIERAKVTRVLPQGIEIEVVEYEAEALISMGEKLFLLTPKGEPFKPLEDGDPFDLPVLSGLTAHQFAIDRPRAVDRARVGLEVLHHYSRLDLSKVHLAQEVHLHASGAVTLTVGNQGLSLELGKGPFRQKLLMAARVIGKLSARGRLPGILFLDNDAHPERVVARMR